MREYDSHLAISFIFEWLSKSSHDTLPPSWWSGRDCQSLTDYKPILFLQLPLGSHTGTLMSRCMIIEETKGLYQLNIYVEVNNGPNITTVFGQSQSQPSANLFFFFIIQIDRHLTAISPDVK